MTEPRRSLVGVKSTTEPRRKSSRTERGTKSSLVGVKSKQIEAIGVKSELRQGRRGRNQRQKVLGVGQGSAKLRRSQARRRSISLEPVNGSIDVKQPPTEDIPFVDDLYSKTILPQFGILNHSEKSPHNLHIPAIEGELSSGNQPLN
ncbi:hypothetical protein Acr_00g0086120 [Actinidia rufa]|uniref:Uncharacterized protein n=1 Tax=Actinidia rufa TaxID=165716 RepID=A0A7J0DY74_9ERIC|nr:hypothetical protein Acr_00g0086120 [Actinidia rufa]